MAEGTLFNTTNMIKAALLTLLLSSPTVCAFQPHALPSSSLASRRRRDNSSTHLQAKNQIKKSKKSAGGGFGATGGFGSKKSSDSAPADPSKVRSVSGYTGSGTKVLAAAANNFDRIRKLFGKDATTDIYIRSPLNDKSIFWFVGKVVRMTEEGDTSNELVGSVYPTEEEAIVSQKRLILEYAKNNLRPQNMGGPYSKNLELWSAPGDSEMDVVQNKINLVPITGSTKDLRDGFNVNDVGLNPEIYVGDEKEKGGLRVVRDEEGRPVKAAFDIGTG